MPETESCGTALAEHLIDLSILSALCLKARRCEQLDGLSTIVGLYSLFPDPTPSRDNLEVLPFSASDFAQQLARAEEEDRLNQIASKFSLCGVYTAAKTGARDTETYSENILLSARHRGKNVGIVFDCPVKEHYVRSIGVIVETPCRVDSPWQPSACVRFSSVREEIFIARRCQYFLLV